MEIYKIVGAHYRPPAKAILQALTADVPLTIRREPDNEFDPNAIQVLVKSADIPESRHVELDLIANGYGYDLDSILKQPEWHLGYIPKTQTLPLQLKFSTEDYDPVCKMSFTPEGDPAVGIVWEPKQ